MNLSFVSCNNLWCPKFNILINRTGCAVLAGFSLITFISDQSTIPPLHADGGTIQWMSPELIDPENNSLQKGWRTKESDCYALGMVGYEILSGYAPFSTMNPTTIPGKVLGGEHPKRPQGAAGALFTGGIWDVVEHCWKIEPRERASAKDVFNALTR